MWVPLKFRAHMSSTISSFLPLSLYFSVVFRGDLEWQRWRAGESRSGGVGREQQSCGSSSDASPPIPPPTPTSTPPSSLSPSPRMVASNRRCSGSTSLRPCLRSSRCRCPRPRCIVAAQCSPTLTGTARECTPTLFRRKKFVAAVVGDWIYIVGGSTRTARSRSTTRKPCGVWSARRRGGGMGVPARVREACCSHQGCRGVRLETAKKERKGERGPHNFFLMMNGSDIYVFNSNAS